MSLRVRLIASIILVLLVSLGAGCASAGWNTARLVLAEVQVGGKGLAVTACLPPRAQGDARPTVAA